MVIVIISSLFIRNRQGWVILVLISSSTWAANSNDNSPKDDHDNQDDNIQNVDDTADSDSETENFENEAGQFYKI